MDNILFTIHDRPGLSYPPKETAELVDELREFASLSLNPLPHYQIFANANDKVVITAHTEMSHREKGELLAFTSAVLITIPSLPEDEREVLHTGLTVVAPSLRRKGMLVQLFVRLILYVYSFREPTSRLWITSLAEVPNSLVHIASFFSGVFPSPSKLVPGEMDLLIARTIDREHRDKMLISPTAVFDEDRFVFKGSNGEKGGVGSVFFKDVHDPKYWHRNRMMNDFYRSLLKNEGDEVLQVAYIDQQRIDVGLRALGNRAKL